MKNTLLAVTITASLFAVSLNGCTKDDYTGTTLTGSFDMEGHRGARGKRPENTIPAFLYCMEQGMTTLELDTVVTRDKELIIHHDTELNGTICLDSRGNPAQPVPVKNLTVAELKTYDCGALKNEKFPEQQPQKGTRLSTLKELFRYVRAYEKDRGIATPFMFNAEIKLEDNAGIDAILEAARLMVKAIEDAGMTDRVIVQSFVMEALKEVRRLNPSIRTSALFEPTYPQGFLLTIGAAANSDEIIEKTVQTGASIISPYYLYCSGDFIKKCHDKNIAVVPWTVNETDIMERLMKRGVDGIISDYPDRLKKAYDDHKKAALK